jgi:hypothetical protein
MEPVFMVLAQSAAAAACMANDAKETVQQVDVKKLQQLLKQNPLMDGSEPDVLADNDDTTSVVITGNWEKRTSGGYGPSWLIAAPSAKPQTVQFRPHFSASGSYAVYTYVPETDSPSMKTRYIINNGTIKEMSVGAVPHVEGQTSGEWVSLGTYKFQKGDSGTVTISSDGANGYVAADAILFVCKKGRR